MATDYKKIAEEHEKRYGWDAKPRRIYKRLYSNKTHFVYELIQNADDSESQNLELQLDSNALLVWNDGRQFEEKDVRNICSLGSSDKDLTNIGTFGIGFKAVYNYTDFPEIYSDDERFRIRDFIKPEGIDEITPEIEQLVNEGKTVFRLPFKDSLHQDDIDRLKDRLCNLSKERSLFFLRHLESVEWKDEHNAQKGSYACHRYGYDKIQNVPENESVELVELTGSLNGNNELSETSLVFHKKIHPPKDVIDKLLEQAEDKEEQQRIQQSAGELQPIEVAFKLQDNRIIETDNSVLFAYLPTEKETHLRFLIQARYQTTPPRDNIVKSSDSPWNEWLVKETADFLPEILEQLKASDLLEPAFFNVLPLKRDVENEFKPIAEALQKAMQERAFVPTQSGGCAKAESVFHVDSKGVAIPRGIEYRYTKAQNVYYPHTEILRQLVENNWWHSESSWLHPEIRRNAEEFRRCFKVMEEAGVKPIEVSQVLRWLEEKEPDWFKDQSNEWLRLLYNYLKEQKSHLEPIKKLPLVRRENGDQVCAGNRLVFFPPNTDERREEIKPFLDNLPILQSALLAGEEANEIEAFLKGIGVKPLRRVDMILEGICPQYLKSTKPSAEENRLHVRYLFKVWNDVSKSEQSRLKSRISAIPILRAYKNQNSVAEFRYVKPCDTYLPQAYTSDDDLETYFSVYDGDIWFVDEAYVEDKSDAKAWLQFLKTIGAMDTPQISEIKGNDTEKWDFLFEREGPRTGEDTCEQSWFKGINTVVDMGSTMNCSRSLWNLLIKSLPSEKSKRDAFFQGTYRWYYYKPRSKPFDSLFFFILTKKGEWLPDEQGNFDVPSKHFAPTHENRKLLGDSVTYLHPDFNISTEPAQWLAKKLGILLEPDAESVLNYLRKLSSTEVGVEKVEPLYRFLQREIVGAQLLGKFKKESLIFTSNPEPRWWRSDKVFWKDESTVFDSDRGYLMRDYPETLKPFFTSLGVSEQASQMDYARRIQEIATTEQVEDEKVRERVQRLYKCLQPWREKKWEIIYDSRCWLGKKGDEWGFFTRQELVLKDHPHIGEIFEGEAPFWIFDGDLLSLARNLKVEGCSQAEVEFHPDRDQKEDTDWSEKVRNLRPYLYAFLKSPRLYEESGGNYEKVAEEKLAKFSNCSVWRVKELKVTYELKGVAVADPNPRQSFLDVNGQLAKLWLGSEVNESEYPELIGDALQDCFGVNELGRFVEDLLVKDLDRVLSNWKRKGLETKFLNEDPKDDEGKPIESIDEKLPDEPNSRDVDPTVNESDMRISTDNETPKTDGEDNESLTDETDKPEIHLSSSRDDDSRTDEPEIETPADSGMIEIDESDGDSTENESESPTNLASDITDISSRDTQSSTNTGSGTTQNANEESESETPTVHEDPETGNEESNSTSDESEAPVHRPRPSRGGARWRGKSGGGKPNKGGGTGYGGGGGGGEGAKHRTLKEYLADNPSLFGEGLELVDTEYRFRSGDEADILFKDSSGNPVTVEVKPPILSGSDQEVWQAVKYKHLAAVEYNLPCEEIRSILVAPKIPDDVKKKGKELGIESFEVPQQ